MIFPNQAPRFLFLITATTVTAAAITTTPQAPAISHGSILFPIAGSEVMEPALCSDHSVGHAGRLSVEAA